MRTYTEAQVDKIAALNYRIGIQHGATHAHVDHVREELRELRGQRECATQVDRASKQVAPTSQSGGAMGHAAPHTNGYETRVAMHSPNARHTVTPPIGRSRWAVPAGSVAGRVLTLVTTWFR